MNCGKCRRKVADTCLDNNQVCVTCRASGQGNTNPKRGHHGQRHGERPVHAVRARPQDLATLNALLAGKGGNS